MVRPGAGPAADVFPVRLQTKALGLLWIAGAALSVVWLLLPRADREGDAWVSGCAILTLLWGVGMFAGLFDALGQRYLHLAIGAVQLVITVSYVAAGDPAFDLRLFYVWATPYAALFFGRAAAAAHFAWTVLLLSAALVLLRPGPAAGASIWLTTAGLIAATGTLVAWAAALARRSTSRLQHLADHDVLTDLPNRRLFGRLLDEALADPRTGAAVLLIDLDSFKTINDSHGHEAGDRLLRQVAPRLAARLRASDLLGRYGGDEFVLCLPGTDQAAAAEVLERLDGGLPIGWSVGTATAQAGDSVAALLQRADARLYEGRRQRRGRAEG